MKKFIKNIMIASLVLVPIASVSGESIKESQ